MKLKHIIIVVILFVVAAYIENKPGYDYVKSHITK
jgi:hypothetical protein